jgi:hypothetical protein
VSACSSSKGLVHSNHVAVCIKRLCAIFRHNNSAGERSAPKKRRKKSALCYRYKNLPQAEERKTFLFPARSTFSICFEISSGTQEIIRIQPLDVIALTKRRSLVSCCSRTLIFLSDNEHVPRSKAVGNGQRVIARAITNDNNLLSFPCLPKGRSHRVGKSFLVIEGRDED